METMGFIHHYCTQHRCQASPTASAASFIGMCTCAVICNSHITGPLAGESAAEQLFKVLLFPLTNDGLWISGWVPSKQLGPECKELSFIKLQRTISERLFDQTSQNQPICTQVCDASHPERPVSAVRPRCRWCEAGQSGEPGSGRRCWTCTAEPGWSLNHSPKVEKCTDAMNRTGSRCIYLLTKLPSPLLSQQFSGLGPRTHHLTQALLLF